MSLIPPPNFGFVENDLYRSALPTQANFSFLQTLRLKTVVFLSQDQPSSIFLEFIKEQNVEFCAIASSDTMAVGQRFSEQLALDALKIILNPDSYPVLVCCNLGIHRTGSVIGCLRKIQRWNLSAIFDEFRRYYGNGKPSGIHEQFIELFDVELVPIPDNIDKLPFKIILPKDKTETKTENNYENRIGSLPRRTVRVGSLPIGTK